MIQKGKNDQIKKVAILFSRTGISINHVSRLTDISVRKITSLLYEGISKDLIPDNISKIIYYKIVYTSSIGLTKRKERWNKAFEERKELRKEISEKIDDILSI